jgi:hypothetical protein
MAQFKFKYYFYFQFLFLNLNFIFIFNLDALPWLQLHQELFGHTVAPQVGGGALSRRSDSSTPQGSRDILGAGLFFWNLKFSRIVAKPPNQGLHATGICGLNSRKTCM